MMGGYGLNTSDSEKGQVAGPCERVMYLEVP